MTAHARIPEPVLAAFSSSPTTIVVYLWLDRHANAERLAWPSVERLAELAGCSPRTVKRATARLARAGAIERAGRGRWYVPTGSPVTPKGSPVTPEGLTRDPQNERRNEPRARTRDARARRELELEAARLGDARLEGWLRQVAPHFADRPVDFRAELERTFGIHDVELAGGLLERARAAAVGLRLLEGGNHADD